MMYKSSDGIRRNASHLAVFLINKDFFNGHLKIPGNLKGQQNRRIIAPILQGSDGLPGDLQGGGQFLLGNAAVLSYFF